MSKKKGIIRLVVLLAVIAFVVYTAVSGLGSDRSGSLNDISLGLDLRGGVSITYQVKGDKPSQSDMDDTIYKLQRRVEQYSTEATVYQEGEDRISIEIPGVKDANKILDELGQPGSLYFIREKDSEGNANYSLDSNGKYKLDKTIEELQEDGSIVLNGTDVKNAQAATTQDDLQNKENIVQLSFTKEGTEKFAAATKAALAAKETIAIYYDGELISVPSVNSEIKDGEAQISGSMSFEEADKLASTIRIGGLSLELEELRSNVVGAQLGEEAISTSLKAGAIGLAIVFIFMCVVYLLPGLAASIALLIYTGLILVLLNAFDITLTLPGIAGIILGLGFGVDANIISAERIREEIRTGKGIDSAIQTGFKNAFSAIFDSNITVVFVAVILMGVFGPSDGIFAIPFNFLFSWLGLGTATAGSIYSFGYTLLVSIILNFVMGVLCSRLMLRSLAGFKPFRKAWLYGGEK